MSGLEPGRLSLNTATVREQWGLAEAIEGCARYGIGGISPWRDKLHEMGVDAAAKAIRDAGLGVSGLCRGGWFTERGAIDAEVRNDNRRAVDEAAALGAECLVMVVGGLPKGSKDLPAAWSLVEEGLAETLDYARKAGVKIAIEPLHPMYAADRACVNTMGHALDICDRLGDGIGCAVDVYHVWWDPELETQLARAGKERIMAFHICDWLVPTRDMLTDRGMMGDGVIDIPGIRGLVEAQGFDGLNEVEIFSALDWWKRDPDEVLATIVERGRSVC
ncbi:sugar phosphate isomerase/epimerase family protein [Roseicyclus sp. F158]|uniref:Sugar phosphate isomerase/epimerase family protein n=1 Tax=Tropicimonas omnivorans TaxID=3075590 RepID=A0ABU3DG28_9RHOB|nr:sugar phosphate isomerase/epimerase family protein [Roseicyclus sp. F158]MDT0682671.1 sugar phosphate isomerase/epimerase family protein [Roseicyclus sp. F158]